MGGCLEKSSSTNKQSTLKYGPNPKYPSIEELYLKNKAA